MTEQQIPKFVAALVEHQKYFVKLSTEDAQWAIQKTEAAISKIVESLTGSARDAIEQTPATPPEKLLRLLTAIPIPTITEFRAADKFKPGQTVDGVKVSRYMGDNFKDNFLLKVEENVPAAEIRVHELLRNSRDLGIRAEIGEETTLTHLWELLKLQGNGQQGALLTDGCANIFYILDVNGIFWAVYAYWCIGGWSLGAYSVEYPYGWDAGLHVCSR